MSYGFNIAENLHCYPVIPATTGNIDATGDYVNLKNAANVAFLISMGATGGTSTVQVLEAVNASGGSATARTFNIYAEVTDTGDVLEAVTADNAATGYVTSANDKVFYVVCLESSQLTDGYPYVTVKVSNSGATGLCAIAILSGLRYATSPGITMQT